MSGDWRNRGYTAVSPVHFTVEANERFTIHTWTDCLGSYTRLIAIYMLVPLSTLLFFILFALLPKSLFPSSFPDTSHPRYFPFPLPEILTSVSLWSLSHLLRVPLYSISLSLSPSPTYAVLLSTAIHVILYNLLRLAALPLLLVRDQMQYPYPTWHDPAFHRVWWLALGWSLAEGIVGLTQGYEQIALYRDVLVPEGREEEFLRHWRDGWVASAKTCTTDEAGASSARTATPREESPRASDIDQHDNEISPGPGPMGIGIEEGIIRVRQECQLNAAIRMQVDQDLDRLMALKGREELEEVYGIPVIVCPVCFRPVSLLIHCRCSIAVISCYHL